MGPSLDDPQGKHVKDFFFFLKMKHTYTRRAATYTSAPWILKKQYCDAMNYTTPQRRSKTSFYFFKVTGQHWKNFWTHNIQIIYVKCSYINFVNR